MPRTRRTSLALLSVGALVVAMFPALALSGADAAAPEAPGDSLWTPSGERVRPSSDGHRRRVNPRDYAAYTLDAGALDVLLDSAPDESARGAAPARIQVPAPNGELVTFDVVESPVMEDELAALNPNIRTFAGRAVGSRASIRLDVTPVGFHASVRGAGAAWYVDPAYQGDDRLYLSYLRSALPTPDRKFVEPELDASTAAEIAEAGERIGEGPNGLARQRDYRLALLTDKSYADYFGTANVLAEKTTLVNRVNHVYGDDVGVRMTLIADTNLLNFDTVAKETGANGPCGLDPCFPSAGSGSIVDGCTSALLNRTRFVIGQVVGAHSFDVGHIGLGIDGGGIAGIGVVGGDGKARGCTGLPTPDGDFFAIDYVAHEIGHQFSGNHTFNSSVCAGNRNASTSVEPGGGSSVMAYAGICGSDDLQPHSDPYFSQRSQTEIGTFINSVQPNVNEVQSIAFTNFDTNTDAFTMTFPTYGTTGTITRGSTYNSVGITAAVAAVLPPGGTVTVSPHFSPTPGNPGDGGFTMTFGGTLAGVDVENPSLAVNGFSENVKEIAQGGTPENGGLMTTPGNHNPTVTAPADKSIPRRTPFALTGSATDTDPGDPADLIYLWEQNNIGTSAQALTSHTNGPLFRVFGDDAIVTPAGTLEYESPGENLADGSPTRVFPDMAQVLADNTNAESGTCSNLDCHSEYLPTSTYTPTTMSFRLTARDQGGPNGGTHFDDVALTIVAAAGPFQVTSQATPVSYTGGAPQIITWAVNGTNTPALAEDVKISFSTDGGLTFPTVLAASTDNDGTELVTIPVGDTTTGRIKIEAVDNYFFDVNDGVITVSGSAPPDTTPPQTTITSGPANNSYLLATSATFGYSSNEPGSTFGCTLDGSARACAPSALTLTGLTQRTHTFSVAAIDPATNFDPTPATRKFTVPLDDRALAIAKGPWKRKSQGSAYLGTVSKVKKKGATLTRTVTNAKALVLVVSRKAKYGKVVVFLGTTKLATINLKGATANKVIVPVATFATARSGVVKIVAKSKKQVRIDGLGVVT